MGSGDNVAQPLPFVGVHIPGYEILSQLGAGGMGVVFKALDLNLQRTVALKFLTHIDAGAAVEKERLLREARAASALDHPNIAAVYTVQETSDGRLCMVMAYYGGETLADKLRNGPLQPAKTIALARQIAAGLAHAHEHGIVHRDIKPSNVIVTDDGVAKILDFGLARLTTSSASTQTSMGGTLPYMSPEQVEGKVVDERTDIWALGVLLYQALTGRLPFAADSAVATVMAISSASPAPMPEVSDDLQVIIYRCLCKARDARYASCAKLLKELGIAAAGQQRRAYGQAGGARTYGRTAPRVGLRRWVRDCDPTLAAVGGAGHHARTHPHRRAARVALAQCEFVRLPHGRRYCARCPRVLSQRPWLP